MNNQVFPSSLRRAALVAAWIGTCLVLPATAVAQELENHITLGAGTNLQSGDRPGFQRDFQKNKDGALGIEDLLYYNYLNDETTLTLKARALAGENDYLFDLNITKEGAWYTKLGYREYRVWFDGTGGFHPGNGFNVGLFNEELHLDRGNLWFEAGYVPEDKLNFVLRYDLFTRKGTKDATTWGDTALAVSPSSTRGLLPSFHKIDEKRQQVTATLSQQQGDMRWELAARADDGDYTNSRNQARRAGEAGLDRRITHKEGRDYDLFQVRGAYVNKVHEKLMVTTAVARTKIDSTISGTRIYGIDYDPVYDPAYPSRQFRDEGFLGLRGETEMKQTIGTVSALYQPNERWSVVPALRFEKIEWVTVADFLETNFTPARVPNNADNQTDSQKDWKTSAGSLEVRNRGIKNVSLSFKAEWVTGDGDLSEKRVDHPGSPSAVVLIDRATRYDRDSQKYSATANWYFAPGKTLSVQYYTRARQNDYRSSRDSTAAVTAAGLPSSDRYPAYIANQDFETDDFNVRLSVRLTPKLRSVTRYDYQVNKVYTQDVGGQFGESADSTTHILAQTLSYSPLNRWYLLGSVNYVWDQLKTPAKQITGNVTGRVENSDANYVNFSLASGYALDEGSDLYVDYNLYRAVGSYIDNSAFSVAHGTQARRQSVGVTWFRRLNERTALTMRYSYVDNEDTAVGTLADYDAHLVYAKVQYRF